MKFQSILYAGTTPQIRKTAPIFFKDLQLEYILGIIKKEAKGYSLEPHFYTLPESEEVILYRQQVCRDLEDRTLAGYMDDFCLQMQKSRHSYDLSLQCGKRSSPPAIILRRQFYTGRAYLPWNII